LTYILLYSTIEMDKEGTITSNEGGRYDYTFTSY